MDELQIQRGQQWLTQLVKLMGIDAQVEMTKTEEEAEGTVSSWLTIDESHLTPSDVSLIIGEQGETIDAIQYLANAILHIGSTNKESSYFVIEINGYRVARESQLKELAQQLAEQVRSTGQEVEVTSLSSVERRQIHSLLSQSEDLQTESKGQEPNRRLVIRLR